VSATLYIPRDASALAMGAERVLQAVTTEASRAGAEIRIVRNGSRGMLWLEPLVEVVTPAGRIAYGPVRPQDVAGLFAAGFLRGAAHPLRLGKVEDMPYFAKQERLTFARVGEIDPLSLDDYRTHGGLRGLTRALEMSAVEIVRTVTDSGLRRRGRAVRNR